MVVIVVGGAGRLSHSPTAQRDSLAGAETRAVEVDESWVWVQAVCVSVARGKHRVGSMQHHGAFKRPSQWVCSPMPSV